MTPARRSDPASDAPSAQAPDGHWGDRLTDAVLRTLIGLALRLPYGVRVPLIGRVMRHVLGPLVGYSRRARNNLAFIFPDMPAKARARIAASVCDNAGRTIIENYSTVEFTRRMAAVDPVGPGMNTLASARQSGRPVILVTGHFGNYEAARAALVARGFVVGGLYRPMKNAFFNEHYVRTMQAFGGPVFAQGPRGTAGFVRHLKAGGILVLLFDQHVVEGEVLDFMGKPARTALSAAQLALRYDAALIPFYATRQADGLSFTIDLEAEVAHSDARTMTDALNTSLAARITARPEQWLWVHRRWKVDRAG